MPAVRALISSAKVAILPSRSEMAVSETDTARSSSFFLSSVSSSEEVQYVCLLSSSLCSALSVATMSSIILTTFSKPAVLPWRAISMKSSSGCASVELLLAPRTKDSALPRTVASPCPSCTKLALELGSVFLNSSRASSLFNILIVSARATSSVARVAFTSSHSLLFVSHVLPSSARNTVSSPSCSLVASRSLAWEVTSTPSSPTRMVSSSI
mmetsp:Transcript_3459/g.9200  ORF Transcript_3459/g.9200 Transcript_3459/m.9200 type:complete len:212 (+) Transcript_3459:737-1372(+)